MTSMDWFRNETWDDGVETAFFTKLRRARDKAQYLVIQSYHLISNHPKVTLRLLDEYFSLDDKFHRSQAFVNQALAHVELNDVNSAITSYENALDAEAGARTVLTSAYIELPFLVASRNVDSWYERSLKILEQFRDRPKFPVEHFKWHASVALILGAQGKAGEAKSAACDAVTWAKTRDSGFRYHRQLGLVTNDYKTLEARLVGLCNA